MTVTVGMYTDPPHTSSISASEEQQTDSTNNSVSTQLQSTVVLQSKDVLQSATEEEDCTLGKRERKPSAKLIATKVTKRARGYSPTTTVKPPAAPEPPPNGRQKTTPPQTTRNLGKRSVKILKEWMFSPEHIEHPYPTDFEKIQLAEKAGVTKKQLGNWFVNARQRLWQQKPGTTKAAKQDLRQVGGVCRPSSATSLLERQQHSPRFASDFPPVTSPPRLLDFPSLTAANVCYRYQPIREPETTKAKEINAACGLLALLG